jgi:hypothetical protein
MCTFVRPVALALSAALLLGPAAALAGEPPGADSPQALVARLEAAAAKQDLAGMVACMTPDARREMALMMVAGVGMMVAFMGMGSEMGADMAEGMAEGMSGEELPAEEKAKLDAGRQEAAAKTAELTQRYEAVLDRHGVTAMMDDETPMPSDPAARTAELRRLFAKTDEIALLTDLMAIMEGMGEGSAPPAPVALGGEVTDYRIDGDRATAQSANGEIQFVRIDGRWYAEPPATPSEEPAADPAGEPAAEPAAETTPGTAP